MKAISRAVEPPGLWAEAYLGDKVTQAVITVPDALAYPHGPKGPPKRRARLTYAKWVFLFGAASLLWALHGLFHMEEARMGWQAPNLLSPLFAVGYSASMPVHVLVEVIIGIALGAAFVREVIRAWRS